MNKLQIVNTEKKTLVSRGLCTNPKGILLNYTSNNALNPQAEGEIFGRLYLSLKFSMILFFAVVVAIFPYPEDASAFFSSGDSNYKLFGSSERKSSRLKPFPKWLNMLSRNKRESISNLRCSTSRFDECSGTTVGELVERLQGSSAMTMLREVNQYMNESRYLTDPRNWGIPDYWETPSQFFARRGDCEDYAIVKYMTLKRLGISPDDMRIVVLMDNNLRIHHSVLAVYLGGNIYILDNQIKQVMKDTSIYHYDPIFSINEKYWWRHQ